VPGGRGCSGAEILGLDAKVSEQKERPQLACDGDTPAEPGQEMGV
jgi:hypothetical protein